MRHVHTCETEAQAIELVDYTNVWSDPKLPVKAVRDGRTVTVEPVEPEAWRCFEGRQDGMTAIDWLRSIVGANLRCLAWFITDGHDWRNNLPIAA